jgi:hypothetical protein
MTTSKGANKPKNAIFLCATNLALLPASGLTRRLTHRLIEPPTLCHRTESRKHDAKSKFSRSKFKLAPLGLWTTGTAAVEGINKVMLLACRAAALDVCPICEVRRLAAECRASRALKLLCAIMSNGRLGPRPIPTPCCRPEAVAQRTRRQSLRVLQLVNAAAHLADIGVTSRGGHSPAKVP